MQLLRNSSFLFLFFFLKTFSTTFLMICIFSMIFSVSRSKWNLINCCLRMNCQAVHYGVHNQSVHFTTSALLYRTFSVGWDSGHLLRYMAAPQALWVSEIRAGCLIWCVLLEGAAWHTHSGKDGDTVREATFWCERAAMPAEDTHPNTHTKRVVLILTSQESLGQLSWLYKSVKVEQVMGVSKMQNLHHPSKVTLLSQEKLWPEIEKQRRRK